MSPFSDPRRSQRRSCSCNNFWPCYLWYHFVCFRYPNYYAYCSEHSLSDPGQPAEDKYDDNDNHPNDLKQEPEQDSVQLQVCSCSLFNEMWQEWIIQCQHCCFGLLSCWPAVLLVWREKAQHPDGEAGKQGQALIDPAIEGGVRITDTRMCPPIVPSPANG